MTARPETPAPPAAAAGEEKAEDPSPSPSPSPAPSAPRPDRPRATPAARAAARDAGLDLAAIDGTGPRGRVQRADIPRAKTRPAPAPAPARAGSDALHVRSTGKADGPPVVMLHGFAADGTAWAAQERALAPRHRVHRIDLPGHGRSPPRAPEGFADLAARIRGAFDALDLAAPAHLIGHSLGGALALATADTRPRAVSRLTLVAPAGLGAEIGGDILAGLLRATRPDSLAPWLRRLVADPDALSWGYVQAAASARADPELRAAQTAMADRLFPDGTQAFDLRAALHRAEMPTALIWGRDDAVLPWRHALQAPGRAALHLLPGVGHMPMVEDPDTLAAILTRP